MKFILKWFLIVFTVCASILIGMAHAGGGTVPELPEHFFIVLVSGIFGVAWIIGYALLVLKDALLNQGGH